MDSGSDDQNRKQYVLGQLIWWKYVMTQKSMHAIWKCGNKFTLSFFM